MDDVLRMFRDATGYNYDGNTYDIGENSEHDDGESDVDIPIEQFDLSHNDNDSDIDSDNCGNESDDVNPDNLGKWNNFTDVVVRDLTTDSGPNHELEPEAEPFDYFTLILPERLIRW